MEKTIDTRVGAYYFKFKELPANEKTKTILIDADIKRNGNDCISAIRIKEISSNKFGYDKNMLFDVLRQICEEHIDISVLKEKDSLDIVIRDEIEGDTDLNKHTLWQSVFMSSIDVDNDLDLIGLEIII